MKLRLNCSTPLRYPASRIEHSSKAAARPDNEPLHLPLRQGLPAHLRRLRNRPRIAHNSHRRRHRGSGALRSSYVSRDASTTHGKVSNLLDGRLNSRCPKSFGLFRRDRSLHSFPSEQKLRCRARRVHLASIMSGAFFTLLYSLWIRTLWNQVHAVFCRVESEMFITIASRAGDTGTGTERQFHAALSTRKRKGR